MTLLVHFPAPTAWRIAIELRRSGCGPSPTSFVPLAPINSKVAHIRLVPADLLINLRCLRPAIQIVKEQVKSPDVSRPWNTLINRRNRPADRGCCRVLAVEGQEPVAVVPCDFNF